MVSMGMSSVWLELGPLTPSLTLRPSLLLCPSPITRSSNPPTAPSQHRSLPGSYRAIMLASPEVSLPPPQSPHPAALGNDRGRPWSRDDHPASLCDFRDWPYVMDNSGRHNVDRSDDGSDDMIIFGVTRRPQAAQIVVSGDAGSGFRGGFRRYSFSDSAGLEDGLDQHVEWRKQQRFFVQCCARDLEPHQLLLYLDYGGFNDSAGRNGLAEQMAVVVNGANTDNVGASI
jgi:hypothetical protein